jgi:hypothetical protein
VVIGAELGRDDHGSIPRNCDREGSGKKKSMNHFPIASRNATASPSQLIAIEIQIHVSQYCSKFYNKFKL